MKLFKFFAWGIPAFAIALPLNYALVKWAELTKPIAYALVLAVQISINFFACRFFVFETDRRKSLWKSFALFVHGIVFFRLADWGVYSLLTTQFGLPFIGVQLFNVALFGLVKFEFSKRVFESRKPTP